MGDNNPSRRQVLQRAGGIAGGLSLFPTVTSARGNNRSREVRFRNALKKARKNTWSREQWFKYIEKTDIEYGNIEDTVEVQLLPKNNDDGPSTNVIAPFEPADLTLTMSYYSVSSNYDAVQFHWQFERGIDDTYTGEPKDLVKIGHASNHYYKPDSLDGDEAYSYDSYVESAPGGGLTSGGLAAQYNGCHYVIQNPLIGEGYEAGDCSLPRAAWMVEYVDPNSLVSPSNRELFFSYSMLYDNAQLDSVSFASDGVVGFSISSEQDSWTVSVGYEQEDIRGGKQYNP